MQPASRAVPSYWIARLSGPTAHTRGLRAQRPAGWALLILPLSGHTTDSITI